MLRHVGRAPSAGCLLRWALLDGRLHSKGNLLKGKAVVVVAVVK